MSSPLEGAPQNSQIFSVPAVVRRSWLKLAAAFAAGVAFAAGAACSVLVITVLTAPHKAAQPQETHPRTPTEAASDASPLPAARTEQPAALSSPQASQASASPAGPLPAAPAPVANSAPAAADPDDPGAKPSADLNCERQTWPYVDHRCARPDANGRAKRSVRVIATERSAPATITTAVPVRVQHTTDGLAPPPGSAAHRTTDGSSGDVTARAPAASDRAQRPGGNIAAATDVPLPRPKPDALARTAAIASVPNELRQAAATAESAGEPRSLRKSGIGRSQAHRGVARRDTATTGAGSETRRGNTDPREAQEEGRAVRSGMVEEPAGVVRPRAGTAPDDGYILVRSYRMRDGRRASVRQKQVEEEGGAAAREERPRPPFPFSFNPAPAE